MTLALLAAYAITLAFVLHLLAASKRREEAAAGAQSAAPRPRVLPRRRFVASPPAVRVLGAHSELGRLVATVHDTLGVEKVAVVLSDADDPGTGVVAACFGVAGLLGTRVPVLAEPATGLLDAGEVTALGLGGPDPNEGRWAVAQLPITGADELLGALTMASRREREFDAFDLSLLERLAREGAPQFDRRRNLISGVTA